MKALLVAEGSGGHLIPALEVARALSARGARVRLCYAQRPSLAAFADSLARAARDAAVEVEPWPVQGAAGWLRRAWRATALLPQARRTLDAFQPHVVVGFGGLTSVPLLLAARLRGIRCLLHEQNVVLGRANRWLAPWMDQVAVSFRETHESRRNRSWVTTGLPVRPEVGQASRAAAADRLGLDPARPTVFIFGGSQGSRALNRLMCQVVARLSDDERTTWQFIHVTGPAEAGAVRRVYAAQRVRAWISAFLSEVGTAYAHADVVLARAGASTVAELARTGTPALLIPYPHAGGHQRENARIVEAIGGGIMLEEAEASPARVHLTIGYLLRESSVRANMAARMRALDRTDAAQQLAQLITDVAGRGPRRLTRRSSRTAWEPAYVDSHS